ncbi:MAG: hybrid sensor histidine kinase/response regulator [Timaviella obliquedivisa GSE-PSE-MK23-08B]|jgi:signal transduction histidine kinase|nr:hybrid sensor histidine kinase/response regulator [Timaviella obliquedivisa GSE-PSE-MK23-08B]
MSSTELSKIDSILAVDDTPDNLLLLEAILSEEGYDIHTAEDGASALKHVEQSPPDLILLDVMMPGMNGYEVTQHIRKNSALPFIPILLITAFDHSSVVEGLDIGADEFVRKPVDPEELLARVRSLLRLKHSIDERELMMRQREDFVSRLTHDLRTPLVAADRMLNLFLQEAFCELSPDMKDAIAVMVRSNKSLLQMTNTLLEVHRYDAGQKSLVACPCNLWQLTCDVIQELKPLAEEKNLDLKSDFRILDGDDEMSVVMGDRLELRRVLINLIGNAIKFTEQGTIEVRVVVSLDENDDNQTNGQVNASKPWISIEVEDTGTGIESDDQIHLFERFRPGKHRRSGSGLGLYLSRRIVEAHSGKINVASTTGKGSKFVVKLPATTEQLL